MDVIAFFCGFLCTTRLTLWTLTILLSSIDLAKFWTSTTPLPLIYIWLFTWIIVFWCLLQLLSIIMSKYKCCVPNCSNIRGGSIIFHVFPNHKKELQRFEQWTSSIGGDILSLPNDVIFKNRRVCHSHFEPQYYTRSKRLSASAVPTLLLPGTESLNRQPMQDISNITYSIANRQPPQPVASTSQQSTASTLEHPDSPTSKVSGRSKNKQFATEIIQLGKKIKLLQKRNDSTKSRLKKALKLSENITFKNILNKFTTAAMIFTMLQFRESGKHIMGRRFNKQEKVLALALYKQGPKAYRWLRKYFVLPSPLTLSKMIATAALKPGINENLFQQLKKRAKKMNITQKLCILIFDEIALTPHFDYIKRNDYISGFTNDGETIKMEIADHALVFMLRGIHKNYKQPIAYTFCAGTTSKMDLVIQIKKMITKLTSIGFKVLATICDQGTSNVSAINWLLNETRCKYLQNGREYKHNVFEVDGEEIVPLYDVPHLMKGIRNNLLNKNLKVTIDGTEKMAKWDHIIGLYKENPAYQGLRLMPKLTENHVVPKKIPKMKVKYATQVFSRSVAVNMGFLANIGMLPKECQDTADVLLFFDNLFDSLNGSFYNHKKRSEKPLLGSVTPQSKHKKIWSDAKIILKSMRFVNNYNKSASVPSIKNWLQTITNIEYIIDILSKKYRVTSVWMRHFNQDPLENFFGCIRSHGCRNNAPTCAAFETAFASLLINNLSSIHSPGSNCEADSCIVFKSLKTIFFNKPQMLHGTVELDFEDICGDHIFREINEKMNNPKIRAQLEYVTGYVLKNLNTKKCNTCKQNLHDKKENSIIKFREIFPDKTCLTYPTYALVKCFSNIQDVVTNILQKGTQKENIKQYIKTLYSVLINYNFIICTIHKDEIVKKIEDIATNLFLYSWCKHTNSIINGSRSDYDANNLVQVLAVKYRNKRK